jgi:hypothetical protein
MFSVLLESPAVYGKKRPWIFHVKLEKIYEEEKSSR